MSPLVNELYYLLLTNVQLAGVCTLYIAYGWSTGEWYHY